MTRVTPPADEPIRDFVRSRLDVAIPPSLTDQVMRAVASGVETRTSRFSPMLAGLSAALAVAGLFAAALILSGPRNIGPDPAPLPSVPPTATPEPTLTAEADLSLLHPGDVVRIPAIDDAGRFGTIVLERGEERAGYPGTEMQLIWPENFFLEIHVRYELDRPATRAYGYDDWAFRLTEPTSLGDMTGAYISYEFNPGDLPLLPRRQSGDEPSEGWVILDLPSEAAEVPVTIAYTDPTSTPADQKPPLAEITVREPAPPIGTSVMPTPPPGAPTGPIPMPSPSPDPAADDLFATTERCASDAGYELEFPASWYANAAANGLPACSWFAPVPFGTDNVSEPPDEVVIVIELRHAEGIEPEGFEWVGAFGGGIGGFNAFWWERESVDSELLPAGERILYYELLLDGESPLVEPDVDWIYAGTTTLDAADDAEYELNKAVLHRIMASIDIADR